VNKFAIFVTVKIKEGMIDAFLPHALQNATSAVRDEADCQMFRVLQNKEDPSTVHFFEVYTSADCLDAHRETPHYKAYDAVAGHMIADKQITKVDVLQ